MKYLSFTLFMGILAGLQVIYSLIYNTSDTTEFLFFEVNVWLDRLIWALGSIGCFYEHFKRSK